MDEPIHLQDYIVLPALGLDVPPLGETPFEALVSRWREGLAHAEPGGVLLAGAASVAEARAFALACQEEGRPFAVACACDEDGQTSAETDVLALLIVMEGMGAAAFGLAGPAQAGREQLDRLAGYASVPLFRLTAEGTAEPWPYTSAPRDPDVIPCAGNRQARFITPDVDVGEVLECSPDLLEDILRAEDEPVGALKLAILDPDDLDIFAEHQYAVEEALCLCSDVPELMEGALRLYQGRAFYDGTGELDGEFLAQMGRKYGLVVL